MHGPTGRDGGGLNRNIPAWKSIISLYRWGELREEWTSSFAGFTCEGKSIAIDAVRARAEFGASPGSLPGVRCRRVVCLAPAARVEGQCSNPSFQAIEIGMGDSSSANYLEEKSRF